MADTPQFKYTIHVSFVLSDKLPAPPKIPVKHISDIDELKSLGFALCERAATIDDDQGTYAKAVAKDVKDNVIKMPKQIVNLMYYSSRPVDRTWTDATGDIWLHPVTDKNEVCVAYDGKVYWQLGLEVICEAA